MRALVVAIVFTRFLSSSVLAQDVATVATCDAWAAGAIEYQVPPIQRSILDHWFGLDADNIGLPEGCERPWLPPEMNTGRLAVWHEGNGFCYYILGDAWFHCVVPPS
jgi:hypothetical protein